MRVLVIGANGFVGPHLCHHLESTGDEVVRADGPGGVGRGTPIDVRDARAVKDVVESSRPDAVVHLAAISSVAQSHDNPTPTFEVNALGALNVCVALRGSRPAPRLLYVSSGEVYGAIPADELASEQAILAPSSPYAASKVSAEAICFQYARSYGLEVVCARPFNHLGAGQASTFAIPSFAHQLQRARRAGSTLTISVGNLTPVRDFSHVRDVVAAYRLLIERGVSGEAYNIASGGGRSIRSILDELIELVGIKADISVDPAKLRPVDMPYLVGNAGKLRALGWSPRWTVRDALTDVLADVTGS